MITERMLKLLLLVVVVKDYCKDLEYTKFLDDNYDMDKLSEEYKNLGTEFLQEYALNKTPKEE